MYIDPEIFQESTHKLLKRYQEGLLMMELYFLVTRAINLQTLCKLTKFIKRNIYY